MLYTWFTPAAILCLQYLHDKGITHRDLKVRCIYMHNVYCLSLFLSLSSLSLPLPPSPLPILHSLLLLPLLARECSPSYRQSRDSDKSNRLWSVQSRRRELTDADIVWHSQLPRTRDTQDCGNGRIRDGCRLLEHGRHSLYHVSK